MIFILLLIGLMMTNYWYGLLLLGVVIIALLIELVRSRFGAAFSRHKWKILGGAIFLLLIGLAWLILLFSNNFYQFPPVIEQYTVVVEPSPSDANQFVVKESGLLDCEEFGVCGTEEEAFSLPPYEIESQPRGFLIREVTITPLKVEGQGRLTLPNGILFSGPICTFACPSSQIELSEFPQNAFYDAPNTTNLEVDTYLDTETVTWEGEELEEGIRFAYVPAPFHFVRGALRPFIGLTSLPQWLFLIVMYAFTKLVEPLFFEAIQNRIKRRFPGLFPPDKGGDTAVKIEIVEGDKITTGDITNADGIAIGRHANSNVNKEASNTEE